MKRDLLQQAYGAMRHDLRKTLLTMAGMARMIEDGFGADAAGEDRFDSVLGVLAVINVLAGHRPDGTPDDPWLRRWEGGRARPYTPILPPY